MQEPVAEPARVVSGGFRFQPQRAQAVPYPSQNVRPASRRPGEISPATQLRAATEQPPEPEQASAAAYADGALSAPASAPLPAEERGGNLFARVREFAFTRSSERPTERHAPRFGDRGQQTPGNGSAALSGNLDELSDIPSFLRRERERVDG